MTLWNVIPKHHYTGKKIVEIAAHINIGPMAVEFFEQKEEKGNHFFVRVIFFVY